MVPGGVPEWLGTGLQNLLHRFNSGPRLSSGRAPATAYNLSERALSSGGERFLDAEEVRGSNPLAPTSNESTSATMKLTTITHVSVDGVMQGLGGADEDRRGGFERGGWAPAAVRQRGRDISQPGLPARRRLPVRPADLRDLCRLLGVMPDPDNNPIAGPLNRRHKYVASTTLTDPQWADTTVLSGDVAAAIGELKTKPAGELQVHGSGALIRWLLENDLVDEITLFTYPVVIGQGTRLFADAGPDVALDL